VRGGAHPPEPSSGLSPLPPRCSRSSQSQRGKAKAEIARYWGPCPRVGAGLPVCWISVIEFQDPHFVLELFEMMSSRRVVSTPCWRWAQLTAFSRVQRAFSAKSEISHEIPISWATKFSSPSLWQLRYVQSISGCLAEICCGCVQYSVDLLGQRIPLQASNVYSFPIHCTNGLAHGVARSALPLRRWHSGALRAPAVLGGPRTSA
jgi:hypothetical protein